MIEVVGVQAPGGRMDYDKTDIPVRYDRSRALPDAVLAMWLDRLTAHVPPAEVSRIIDLGCGTGRFTFALAERHGADVLAIDPSEKMLAEARRKAGARAVTFQRGNGDALDAEDGSIDLVFLSMVFHHLREPAQTAKEAHRVLRPGGFVALRNGSRDQLASFAHARFFPGYAALAETHLPSVATIREAFVPGFDEVAHEVLTQATSSNWDEFAAKAALRADSLVMRLSEAEFEAGMEALRAYAAEAEKTEPVTQDIDFFVFRKSAV